VQLLSSTSLSKNPIVATGGDEEMLKLWDLSTAQPTWKARNVPNDKLDLRVPVYVRDLDFIPKSTTAKLVTGTAYHQIRLYDTKASQRPVWTIKPTDRAVCSVLALSDGHTIVSGDGAGDTYMVDIRNSTIVGKLKGVGGAVTCLQQSDDGKYLASASLDRFVRVYSTASRTLVNKVYVKQRLRACLFFPDQDGSEPADDAEDEDDDEVWDLLAKRDSDGVGEGVDNGETAGAGMKRRAEAEKIKKKSKKKR